MPARSSIALVTRAKTDQGAEDPLVKELQALEVPVKHIPLVKQQALDSYKKIPSAKEANWLVFTSATAIHYFHALMETSEWITSDMRVAAVGPKTAEAAKAAGYSVDVIPDHPYTAEALAEVLSVKINIGDTVVLPKSKQARPVLAEFLRRQGANVFEAAIYETTPKIESAPDLDKFLMLYPSAVITFASPSSVQAFTAMQTNTSKVQALCIGSITAEAARSAGFSWVQAASTHTFADLAKLTSNYVLR
ncbi:uroporphyrinogen-III synthase [Geomicrobium halophilum]|uniref:Uroporphyrinogen-III synthase n=1 Tax=Geomicrobium halophilum TaxID=549000 RepID=A0A841PWS4_9BACL|nr:uroporphyrinogen-III synthase [Geomicrobium halophilum]MBB6448335.1 uroporphyrinogen-III synthase [Geomicrobium halophilum]